MQHDGAARTHRRERLGIECLHGQRAFGHRHRLAGEQRLVVAQLAKRKFNVPTVIARILDPLRAEWYEKQGVNTVCPTRIAIEMLEKEVLEAAGSGSG